MIDFNSESDWDTIKHDVIRYLPAMPAIHDGNAYNQWLNVIGLAKEADYSLEEVQSYMPSDNGDGLDESKWNNLKTGRNDKLTARKILFSIAKDNGYSLPITEKYQQKINWIARTDNSTINNNIDISNAKKVINLLYPNGESFYICNGRWNNQTNRYTPDTCSIKKVSKITDELLNQYYFSLNGTYIQLNKVDDKALEDAKAVKKSAGIKDDMILDYKYYYIESDPADGQDYDAFIESLKKQLENLDLPWISMTFSGKKSIHTIIRLDATTADEFSLKLSKIHKYLEQHNFPYDKAIKNPARWGRFFVGSRHKEGQVKYQYVIAINDNIISFDEWYHRHPELMPKKSCNGLFSAGKVDTNSFYDLMKSEGVYRVNENGKHKAVQTTGKFIKEITVADVSDIFSEYIKNSDDELNEMERKSLQSFKKGLNETIYRNFDGLKPLIHTDTKEAVYLYFKNGILEVKKDQTRLIDYNSFEGYVWQDAYKTIKYDFMPADNHESMFSQFLRNITGTDENFKKFKSAIGYAMSRYKDFNCKALFLTDKQADVESEESTGGTGKGLIVKALKIFRSAGGIDGKQLKSDDRFLFSAYKDNQSLYVIQDILPSFRMESIYNIITDEFCIEKKGKDKEIIDFEKSPKIVITSNHYPKNLNTQSTLRRLCFLELENHYNSEYTPEDDFHCKFYSDDWTDAEWKRFFAFFVDCIQYYLNNGLITANSETVKTKIQESSQSAIVREYIMEQWQYDNSHCAGYHRTKATALYKNFKEWGYDRRCMGKCSDKWFYKALRKFPYIRYNRETDGAYYTILDPEDPSAWENKDETPF